MWFYASYRFLQTCQKLVAVQPVNQFFSLATEYLLTHENSPTIFMSICIVCMNKRLPVIMTVDVLACVSLVLVRTWNVRTYSLLQRDDPVASQTPSVNGWSWSDCCMGSKLDFIVDIRGTRTKIVECCGLGLISDWLSWLMEVGKTVLSLNCCCYSASICWSGLAQECQLPSCVLPACVHTLWCSRNNTLAIQVVFIMVWGVFPSFPLMCSRFFATVCSLHDLNDVASDWGKLPLDSVAVHPHRTE